MSLWYEVLYRAGITPWEEDAAQGPVAQQAATLFAREEVKREPPYGRALDLGCGSGIWSIALGARGWEVTGIDIVARAIEMARARARDAGVDVRFVEGDVTALQVAGVGKGYDLIIDFECFNHLNETQRTSVGREVSAVATADASLIMLVWKPAWRGPLPSGVRRSGVEAAFPGWKITDETAYDKSTLPLLLKNVDPCFYRLRRASAP